MIRINTQPIQSSLPDKTPLLNLLRDELGLSGAKLGCGEGECGACMVLVDGRPQTSCNLPLWAVQDHDITTLEGLGSAERPHALQEAFIAENAGQCGYCLSGILVSASALLQHTPRPTRADICAALDKHLCRCGAHERIIRAVQRAAQALAG
ncbi:MAG: (2Fe-2S)-binding protein [Betaproteobacteria bacterium]|jgi:nicotinate dehydrogenase subunit A|nr:(2Fe-2S)-binding protein [Betaproteobacteria bacterium]NBU43234.1 (2Fe-2S)-binding protein [Betaproteobacteria bacterium]NCW39062.1 (2Fe-2S)-binding protein [Betaproteobacteria bacterium]NDF63927.1 (2Fe-2S)-binding protein [Betaproteobacteria bacterium]